MLLQRAQSASSREAAVASGRGVFLLGQPTRWMWGAAAVSLLAGINYLRIQARVHPQLCLSVTERVYIVNKKDGLTPEPSAAADQYEAMQRLTVPTV